MTISAFPPAPSISDTTNFATEADAWVTHFTDTFVDELDTAIAAFNFNSTNSTSTTSDTIATGSTTITVQASKSYVVGMTVKIAYTTTATDWMLGEVTAYDSGTGSLTVYVRQINGSGTQALWTISLAATPNDVGDHIVTVHTGNGHGSSSTKIRRFTTAMTNTGTAITYADSATLGASFTINEDGFYELFYADSRAGGGCRYGASLNTASPTQAISSIGVAERILPNCVIVTAAVSAPITRTVKLVATDIIRPHTDGTVDATGDECIFSIRKVSNG
jgi:hypothetical protein